MRSRLLALTAALTAASALAACNSDGRTLRPPGPGQQASISTLGAVTTTTLPARFDTVAGEGTDDTLDPFATDATDDVPVSGDVAASDDIPVSDATPASGDIGTGVPVSTGPLTITAPWADGAAIPKDDTCDGADVAPAFTWSPAPAGTVEVAITLTDDQAPGFVHWVMAGIDPSIVGLKTGQVPDGAIQATNSSGKVGYAGPCPPAGTTHTYRLTVHFLSQATELDDAAPGADLLAAVEGATFAQATVTGTFARS